MGSKLIYLDLESTGLSIWKDKIVQIGMIYQNKTSSILINPERHIPEGATYIHKITDEMVQDLAPFSFYAPKLYELFNQCDGYVTYNGNNFDLPMLSTEMLRCGYELPQKPSIDVYQMICELEKSKRLGDVYRRFFNQEMVGAHDGLQDCKATMRIYEYLIELYNRKS